MNLWIPFLSNLAFYVGLGTPVFAMEIQSVEDLQSAIAHGKVRSADDAFDLLPLEMSSRPVLSVHGQSSRLGSVKRPRAVMAKPDGEFLSQFMLAKPDIRRLSRFNINLNVPSYYNVWPLEKINTDFNRVVNKTQAKILYESVRKNSRYEDFKYALAVPFNFNQEETGKGFLNLNNFELFKKMRGLIKTEIRVRQSSLRIYLHSLFLKIYGDQPEDLEHLVSDDEIFVEWALQQLGDSLSNYSTSGARPSAVLNDGAPDNLGAGIIREFRILILQEIARNSGAPVSFEFDTFYDGLTENVLDTQAAREFLIRDIKRRCDLGLSQHPKKN